MTSLVFKISAVLLYVGVCAAEISEPGKVKNETLTEICLGCICQAVSGCQFGRKCEGEACGMFRITYAYWVDAEKPTVPGQLPDQKNAHPNCVSDPHCASRAVHAYMRRYAQDCNGDGYTNCDDYVAIHKNGGYTCKTELPDEYVNTFKQCMAAATEATEYIKRLELSERRPCQ